MGQPLKLNDNLIVSRILEATSKGHTKDMAAHYAGVDPSTLHRWIKLGKQGEKPYRAFYRKFERARAEGALSLLDTIKEASRTQWQAAAWLLERCHGLTKDGPPPVQVTIDVDAIDSRALIAEYEQGIKQITRGPTIDLDEE